MRLTHHSHTQWTPRRFYLVTPAFEVAAHSRPMIGHTHLLSRKYILMHNRELE